MLPFRPERRYGFDLVACALGKVGLAKFAIDVMVPRHDRHVRSRNAEIFREAGEQGEHVGEFALAARFREAACDVDRLWLNGPFSAHPNPIPAERSECRTYRRPR